MNTPLLMRGMPVLMLPDANVDLRPIGHQRKYVWRINNYERTQMTAMVTSMTGALSANTSWDFTDWKTIEAKVFRQQTLIAKAYRGGRKGKVKALQWILTPSFHAKLPAWLVSSGKSHTIR